ncbi:serpin [Blomia tropicalis]|nr:serpin [Blomia tropicalis]
MSCIKSTLFIAILVITFGLRLNGQVISYGMRKLALSMNQFGLDILRTIDRIDTKSKDEQRSSFAFCPFCIGSSLAMLLAGLQPNRTGTSTYDSIRHALYLGQMQPQEINLAFYDLAQHLQLNLPDGYRMKRDADLDSSEEILPYDHPENLDDSIEDEMQLDDPFFFGTESRTHEAIISPSGSMKSLIDDVNYPSPASTVMSKFINQFYVQRHLPIDYNYYVMMQYYYKTPIRSLDFAYAGEESRQHINANVEHQTHGKIQTIVPIIKMINGHKHVSCCCLIDFRDQIRRNRGIFNARWKNSKKPTIALMSPSTMSPPTTMPTTIKTQTIKDFNPFKPLDKMNRVHTKESIRLRYSFSSYLNATIVEMPFIGGTLSLLTLVPISPSRNRGMASDILLSRLNAQLIVDLIQNLEIRRIDITKKSTTETKINRVARETEQIVESPIMKIFEHDNEQRQMKKQVQMKSGTMKRIHVSLEDEFVYMILDNISGLILSIGKYYSN